MVFAGEGMAELHGGPMDGERVKEARSKLILTHLTQKHVYERRVDEKLGGFVTAWHYEYRGPE